ncbi:MAG: hypothetical protein KJ574_02195 [Nanoarchaeota archaeon]|nr:hypothetical protein [Nanoarchaeota archaeon]
MASAKKRKSRKESHAAHHAHHIIQALHGTRHKESLSKAPSKAPAARPKTETVIDKYDFKSMNIPIEVTIRRTPTEYVPIYSANISQISPSTLVVLEKIRKELVEQVTLGIVDIRDIRNTGIVEERFKQTIQNLIRKHFPDAPQTTKEFLTTYLIQRSLGLGHIEILNDDQYLEEIVINSAKEPVWVYHKKHGWLKTNVKLESEDKIRHYAASMARRV